MTKVFYVRHCEPNTENRDDYLRELSPKGLLDRKMVTDYLSDKQIDMIFSSPYKRAIDTVKDFADKHLLEIHEIDKLHERIVGGWIDNFADFVQMQWNDHSYRLPNGESINQVQERNIEALSDIIKANPNKNIVIASHGTAMSTVIHYFEPSFGPEEFHEIAHIMPWIVIFEFDEDGNYIKMTEHRFL